MKNKLKLGITCLITFISLLLMITSCKKEAPIKNKNYADIKSVNWEDRIGEEFEVEGFIISEGNTKPIITSEPENYLFDGLYPESEYLHLELQSPNDNLNSFHGKKVRIKGILEKNTDVSILGTAAKFGNSSLATLKLSSSSAQIIDSVSYFVTPTRVSFCDRYPLVCSLAITPIGIKCAILYSGGINSSKAYWRYWNDLKFMYRILISKGYDPANIRVVYKNGSGEDGEIPVHYAANPTGFDGAISYMKAKLNSQSKLFLMFNNHGGGFETSTGNNYGVLDANIDEPEASNKTDEDYCFYGVSQPFLDDSIAAKINRLPFYELIAIVKPCFSGGLIWDLRGSNRVIITSGTEYQVTYSHASGNFGEMTYRFFSAINGMTPDGVAVDADSNNDGKVSMQEAYIFVRDNDARPEQPQFGNSSSGTPTTTPSASSYGSNVYL
ncbi:MAG TPA: hypothetical protein PLJ42_03670 [Chitinophagales bacterium]|jgi:hypothetical protein|nr:hypothetical protein [Chitinophagales bacterium]HQW78509.1 hypothetical protein [Chitinophagales bacterium]